MTAQGPPAPARAPGAPNHQARGALARGDALLDEAACLLPALVAQLEQAIGVGALPPAVIPYVGQARRLEARIREARAAARSVPAGWS